MKQQVTDWMFRALMFEAEAESFRAAGLRLGADQTEVEARLLEEALEPFPLEIRNQSLQMSRTYALLNCFENSVRDLIRERLFAVHDIEWWERGVPKKVSEFAKDRMKVAKANSWLEGDNSDLMTFLEFGHLSAIITDQWEHFSDLIPSQHWLKQRMDELEQARNYIAHNRRLLTSELKRIEMYISDWTRQVGV